MIRHEHYCVRSKTSGCAQDDKKEIQYRNAQADPKRKPAPHLGFIGSLLGLSIVACCEMAIDLSSVNDCHDPKRQTTEERTQDGLSQITWDTRPQNLPTVGLLRIRLLTGRKTTPW